MPLSNSEFLAGMIIVLISLTGIIICLISGFRAKLRRKNKYKMEIPIVFDPIVTIKFSRSYPKPKRLHILQAVNAGLRIGWRAGRLFGKRPIATISIRANGGNRNAK